MTRAQTAGAQETVIMEWTARWTLVLCLMVIAGCSCNMTPTAPDDSGDDYTPADSGQSAPDDQTVEPDCVSCHATAQGDPPADRQREGQRWPHRHRNGRRLWTLPRCL